MPTTWGGYDEETWMWDAWDMASGEATTAPEGVQLSLYAGTHPDYFGPENASRYVTIPAGQQVQEVFRYMAAPPLIRVTGSVTRAESSGGGTYPVNSDRGLMGRYTGGSDDGYQPKYMSLADRDWRPSQIYMYRQGNSYYYVIGVAIDWSGTVDTWTFTLFPPATYEPGYPLPIGLEGSHTLTNHYGDVANISLEFIWDDSQS